MNWFEKFFVGQAVKRLERKAMGLSKNTTTTLLGICAILGAVANAGTAILDGDPATVFNWQQTLALIGGGIVAIKAREQGQHEKDKAEAERIKRAALGVLALLLLLPMPGQAQDKTCIQFEENGSLWWKCSAEPLKVAVRGPGLAQTASPSPQTAQSNSEMPAIALEAGVTRPSDPTAAFGLILGGGATRSYSRFAFGSDGKARQVETGVERVVYQAKRFGVVSRAVAGVVQDENNVSGTISGQAGLLIPLRWGLSVAALGEAGNAPVRDGEWRGGASLTVRWQQ